MMLCESPEIEAFWKKACEAIGISEDSRHYALPFGEFDENTSNEALASTDSIGAMAVNSMKRGTCYQPMQFEKNNVPMLQVGDYRVVVKTDGTPVCVVRVIRINIVPFNQVGPDFAASEGPEDGLIPSHENWSNGHRGYFVKQSASWGLTWRDDNPVVCESFITVFSPEHPLGIR